MVNKSTNQTLAEAQQKALQIKEEISIYDSERRDRLLYKISTDQVLDFSGSYSITDAEDRNIGSVVRHGMRSLWRASYEIKDRTDNVIAWTTERNPVVKLVDGLLGEIPYSEFVMGYFSEPQIRHRHGGRKAGLHRKTPLVFGGPVYAGIGEQLLLRGGAGAIVGGSDDAHTRARARLRSSA